MLFCSLLDVQWTVERLGRRNRSRLTLHEVLRATMKKSTSLSGAAKRKKAAFIKNQIGLHVLPKVSYFFTKRKFDDNL
jgi:hypothetical protein